MAVILDGKETSEKVMEELAAKVEELKGKGVTPTLALVLTGTDKYSSRYVRMKVKRAEKLGMEARFHHLYPLDMPVDEKIRTIATNMYKVADIELSAGARSDLRKIVKLGADKMPICMAKTPLSLTDNDRILGMPPEGYVLPIVRLKPSTGVGFIVAFCGDISTMPAHPSKPAANGMDIDKDGVIKGLS